jgi:CCR4-NOT complex subunit CAF16
VRVLGRPAFHDTSLVADVAILGGPFPFDVDIAVSEILGRQPGIDAERQEELIALLGVDPTWHMHRISDGQRRRVQLLLGLLRPVELLLLDEVTTDLDVIARADLHAFLRDDAERRATTILYATHVLDGLDEWATHLAWLSWGAIRFFGTLDSIAELREVRLHRLVERWLRGDAS